VLWLQGHAEQAVKIAGEILDETGELNPHPISLGHCLFYTASVFVWSGDCSTAEAIIGRLITHAERYSLAPYRAGGIGLKGQLLLRRGDVDAGIRMLCTCLETIPAYPIFTADLAEGLAAAGQVDEAGAVIDKAIAHDEQNGESFHTPEIFRVKGELLAALSTTKLSDAEDWLSRSIQLARRQSALAWELRSTTSLALLRRKQGRGEKAHRALSAIYDRFTEGFKTPDLTAARQLLDELEQSASAGTHAASLHKRAPR
jgi:tetratricopeptide (TPR) repeat protein